MSDYKIIQDKLIDLREVLNELYDNSEPHTKMQSDLFLQVDDRITELQKEVRIMAGSMFDYLFSEDIEALAECAKALGCDVKAKGRYIKGSDLDYNNEDLVKELMSKTV